MLPRLVRILVLILALLLNGCASWAPFQDRPIRADDSRKCNSPNACTDLVIAVDTSASSAWDIAEPDEWKGEIWGYPDAGPGSRLWAALDGLDSAVRDLDPATVGVALIRFSGELDRGATAAWVEAELTNDYAAIETAAARMRERGSDGWSCHACAVRLAGPILVNAAKENRCPVLVILADTRPTLPYGPGFTEDSQREVAKALRENGITESTLVAVGHVDHEEAQRMQNVLESAGGSVLAVNGSGGVANAILTAVESCSR